MIFFFSFLFLFLGVMLFVLFSNPIANVSCAANLIVNVIGVLCENLNKSVYQIL